MTYIEQIAKMLDVEIEEEFKIEGYDDNIKFKFTKNAFMQSCGDGWWFSSCSIMTVLEGYRKLIKIPKPVLTDEEKEYLSYVIKPFREDVLKISKFKSKVLNNKEVIGFETPNGFMIFPPFEKDKMYKNMELNKGYTLDDLGL